MEIEQEMRMSLRSREGKKQKTTTCCIEAIITIYCTHTKQRKRHTDTYSHTHTQRHTYTHVHSCQVRENAARHKCNNNSKKNNNTGADEHKNRTIIKMNNDRLIANK